MYLTTVKFKRALEWFSKSQYNYLLLYISSSTKLDYELVEEFFKYKELIDRQTGELVYFLHFIEITDIYNPIQRKSILKARNNKPVEEFMLYHISTEEAKIFTKRDLYLGVGLKATYQTTDDLCNFFNIPHYKLPAFILINKSTRNVSIEFLKTHYSIFSIKRKEDFDSLLRPLKITNDLMIDYLSVSKSLSLVQSEATYNTIQDNINAIKKGIQRLKNEQKEKITQDICYLASEINILLSKDFNITSKIGSFERPITIKKYLIQFGIIKEFMDKYSNLYYRYKKLYYRIMKWSDQKENHIIKLQHELVEKKSLLVQAETREYRLKELTNNQHYVKELYKKKFEDILLLEDASDLVTSILESSSNLPILLERIIIDYINKETLLQNYISTIREKVDKMQFDIFISCKSEDYELAEEVYTFLKSKGYRPFIASKSLREIGGDKYSEVISEVIDLCNHMIVFASELLYIEAPYVKSEWNMFSNEVKAGRKNGKLLTIIENPKLGVYLPIDLRSREVLSIANYKESICDYLT